MFHSGVFLKGYYTINKSIIQKEKQVLPPGHIQHGLLIELDAALLLSLAASFSQWLRYKAFSP